MNDDVANNKLIFVRLRACVKMASAHCILGPSSGAVRRRRGRSRFNFLHGAVLGEKRISDIAKAADQTHHGPPR